jgi:hypothetical protein
MHRALPALVTVAAAVFLVVVGCSANSDLTGSPLDNAGNGTLGAGGDAAASAGDSGPVACVNVPPPNMNPSTLPSCCTAGAAHCVPSQYVPSADKQALAACSGGYCVPDPFILNQDYLPPACKAYNGTDGVCLSLCVPQVSQYKSILTQGTCAQTELCAPCVNPLTNQPSGACAFKPPPKCTDDGGGGDNNPPTGDGAAPPAACPHVGPPVLDPSTLPACGTAGGAHCLQSALVPPAMASKLATCTGGYCVPDSFIEAGGNFIPPTCSSLEGAEGRCLNLAIPQVAAQASQLTQSTCAVFEKCVPCFSPLDGTDTGSCRLSCDPGPTKPIVLFKSCCNENSVDDGRCIPPVIIPSTEQKNLKADVCAGTDLCVPSEMLKTPFTPQACSGNAFLLGAYTGVCLSNCLSFGIQGILLGQGDCDSVHTCAPCTNPLTGAATGAPGCP